MLRTSASENVYPAVSLTFRSVSVKGKATVLSCRRGHCRFQPGFQLLMIDNPGLLHYHAASAEDHEVWNASHIESCRYIRVALCIELQHYRSSRHSSSRTRDFRRRYLTRSAPGSPEIHEYRNPSFLNDFVERGRVNFERLIHWWQWSLAIPTLPGIGQMFRRDAIPAATGFAGSNYRHNFLNCSDEAGCVRVASLLKRPIRYAVSVA